MNEPQMDMVAQLNQFLMNKLGVTATKSKAIYEEIEDYVLEHMGLKFSDLYIAQVKKMCGSMRMNMNYILPKSDVLDNKNVC